LNHTALTLGYRVTVGGVSVVYATDHEPHAQQLWRVDHQGVRSVLHQGDRRHIEFLSGADLVIHDAQYIEAEYAQKLGWGHSTVEYCVDVAAEAGVKRLALFHHDPSRTDADLDRLVAACQQRADARGAELAVFAAAEGRGVNLRERHEHATADAYPVEPGLSHRPRVLIAEDDADVRDALVDTLADDDYELVVARDGREALGLAFGRTPDLALIDLRMPGMDGQSVCRALRAEPRTQKVPVIILTASGTEADIVEGFEGGATDYITKPFAPAMVRTRVRSWLLRSENDRGGNDS
jgi:CheY-like chemotaxis protein